MIEKEFDLSKNDYIENNKTNDDKMSSWNMAIGLQKVDNLKPSIYLENLLQENVNGEKTIYEVEKELKQYYTYKSKNNEFEKMSLNVI